MKRIISAIEKECPMSLAYPWDNVGLLIGSSDKIVKKVLITLDVTADTAAQAIAFGADAIISHHPVIFSPMKRITDENAAVILDLIKHDICVYSAHTNMDNAAKGINSRLAELFALSDIKVIDSCENAPECGLGRVGTLPEPVDIQTLVNTVKNKLSTPCVRLIGPERSKIARIGVLGGSCSEFIPKAVKMGAEVVITGDLKYHESLDLSQAGITVIDAGHFPTESFVTNIFKEIISNIDGIEIKIAEQSNVFKFV